MPMTPRAVTDRLIAALRARGREVIDVRGELPVNPNPLYRYGLLAGGLAGVEYLIVHWTGDAFTTAVLAQMGVPDIGGDGVIDAELSVADERRLLSWYAAYHWAKDGGTWGGLAYGLLVLPSGRIYVAWDVGTLTYHAWTGANRRSYALSCPISRGVPPTPAQVQGLLAALTVLCEETPEIPAGRSQVYGHGEATFLDSRNSTSCPGTVLPHVRAFRDGTLVLPAPAPPVGEEIRFPGSPYLVGGGFAAVYRGLGERAAPLIGLPESGEVDVVINGAPRRVQLFERATLAWYPPGTPDGVAPDHPFHIRALTAPEEQQARQQVGR